MIRSSSVVLRSSPLAATLIAALTLVGCGGDDGGGMGAGGSSAGRGGGAGRGGAGGATGVAGRGGSGGGGANTGIAGSTAGRGGGGGGGGVAGAAGSTAGAAGSTAGAAGGVAGAAGGTAGAAGGVAGAAGGLGGAAGTAPSCVNGASCVLAGNVSGVCTNGTCLNCGSDSVCSTAYGTGYICTNPTSAGNCVMGNCHNNNECNGRLCVNNACTNCPDDAACVTALGPNHLCQSGTCVTGSCRMNSECGAGQICNATSQCVSCGTNDAACVTAYGTGYICASGSCVTGTCHDNGECTTGGQVCTASHTCGPCSGDSSCGTGRICVSNACVVGNCHTNAGCSGGQVCISNVCTACTSSTQCTSGQVCLPNGTCTAGNCLAGSDCSASQVCLNNSCTTCATDGQCISTTSGHGANHLCNGSGACVAGNCRLPGECAAGGTVCNTSTLFCGACAGDAACVSEYGNGYICNGGVCIQGNCHSTATPACSSVGQICNLGAHACQTCSTGAAGDAQCADTANYGPNHICQNGACINGNCHVAADCNNSQQICTNFMCGTCSTTAQCVTAYGSNHVCSGGACVSGNCNSSADCAGNNQVCNTTTHLCEGCASNTQCVGDLQYGAMHVCMPNGQCLPGNCRDTSADCTGGQICGITTPRVCGSCGTSDTACKNDATYGSTNICLAGTCTVGNCHDTSSDCSAGQVCGVTTAHTCGACSVDGNCTSDTRYGAGNICYQGVCAVGNCHASSGDCSGANTGLLCGVSATNVCGTCGSDSQCKADAFYGTNTICNTAAGANQGKCVTAACTVNSTACSANTGDFCCGGSCTPGNCCNDNDCANNSMFGLGFACSNNNCTQCNNVAGNRYLVDPVNGNDVTANGSGMSGAASAPGCAFKTIARAMQVIPANPPVGTKIILVGAPAPASTGLAAGDNLPIILPANVQLTTQGGPISITLATTTAGNPAGFRLLNNGSSIAGDPAAPLTLNGNNNVSGIAIQVAPTVATNVVGVSNVSIVNTLGNSITVTNGTLNIDGGVLITGSTNNALRVTGGVANITNTAGSQTLFSGNGQHGIHVSGTGSVNVAGTPGAPLPSNNGTVVISFNNAAGIRLDQTVGGTGLVNSIDGVVAWGNANRDVLVYGGSKLKLRNSVLGAGPTGVTIASLGATAAQNDISAIDLGTAAQPGRNYLQVPNGGPGRHSNSGVCVQISGGQADQTVQVAGNFFATNANPGVQLNCATGGGTVGVATNCNNGISFGETTTTTITPVFSMCN